MTDNTIHYFFIIATILSYIIPVLVANSPMKRNDFRIKFKIFVSIILIHIALFYFLPNGDGIYYLEINLLFIFFFVGIIFYISARRYLEIGGSRWNTFVAFVHFPEFMRLWWEEPAEPGGSSVPMQK